MRGSAKSARAAEEGLPRPLGGLRILLERNHVVVVGAQSRCTAAEPSHDLREISSTFACTASLIGIMSSRWMQR